MVFCLTTLLPVDCSRQASKDGIVPVSLPYAWNQKVDFFLLLFRSYKVNELIYATRPSACSSTNSAILFPFIPIAIFVYRWRGHKITAIPRISTAFSSFMSRGYFMICPIKEMIPSPASYRPVVSGNCPCSFIPLGSHCHISFFYQLIPDTQSAANLGLFVILNVIIPDSSSSTTCLSG